MTSSDDDSSDSWTPLSERPEWRDVQPLDLPTGLCPVVNIKYTAKVQEVLGYFRAIRVSKELSPRALELTQEVCLFALLLPFIPKHGGCCHCIAYLDVRLPQVLSTMSR